MPKTFRTAAALMQIAAAHEAVTTYQPLSGRMRISVRWTPNQTLAVQALYNELLTVPGVTFRTFANPNRITGLSQVTMVLNLRGME